MEGGRGALPRDANLATLSLVSREPRKAWQWRLGGELFLFWLHQHLVSHFRSWQMEFCLPARMDDPVAPPSWLLIRGTEIVFKIKIKNSPIFMDPGTCDIFYLRIFAEERKKTHHRNKQKSQSLFFSIWSEEMLSGLPRSGVCLTNERPGQTISLCVLAWLFLFSPRTSGLWEWATK